MEMMPPLLDINVEEEEEEEEEEEDQERPHDFDKERYHRVMKLINEEPPSINLARKVVDEACCNTRPLNLIKDTVLHEVIARRMTLLAVAIISLPVDINRSILRRPNYYGDTPLHIAAAEGDSKVVEALLKKDKALVGKRNRKGETALHKAVQFGHLDVFHSIKVVDRDMAYYRTDDGFTILHYAIMHDRKKEALDIAKEFPKLILTRNEGGASPLQIMAAFYKKPPIAGILNSLLYKFWHLLKSRFIRIDNDGEDTRTKEGITEKENVIRSDEDTRTVEAITVEGSVIRSDRLKQPQSRGNWWSFLPVIDNLRRSMVQAHVEKSNYEELLKLLVRDEDFGFYISGYSRENSNDYSAEDRERLIRPPLLTRTHSEQLPGEEDAIRNVVTSINQLYLQEMKELVKTACKSLGKVSEASDRRIWEESPLITGIKLGLDDFVIKILEVNPKSATYVGHDGMNVCQAAVKYGRRRVVKAIKKNKLLPPWLLTDLESDTKNTLLHIAASGENLKKKTDPLRLQDDLEWFQMLQEKIVPKELWSCRNKEEKTAQEVFDEKHEATLKECRAELAEIGRTCSPLLAAVVFTSSFYIPDEKSRDTSALAFKIFSHVYVVGFSCAAASLIMFLLLVVTPYKQPDFRQAVPRHYLMACVLLIMSLIAFIVAFACNMYLQIYGEKRKSHADLATLLLELLVLPFLCALVNLSSGAFWRFGSVVERLTK